MQDLEIYQKYRLTGREVVLVNMLNKADKNTPITRDLICETFQIKDRSARRIIEDLREKGVRVCGINETEGYWIAKSQQEYERFRRDYVSKATTIIRRAQNMDNQTNEGQVSMYELL